MKELNSDLPFLLKRQIINELNRINRHPAFSVAPGFVFISEGLASLRYAEPFQEALTTQKPAPRFQRGSRFCFYLPSAGKPASGSKNKTGPHSHGRFLFVGVEGFEPPTLPTFSRDALNYG